jgi:HNH endonuclease
MPRRRRISAAVRRQIIERDTQRCAYCRSPMIMGIPMVIEHIIPLVSGGASTPDNLCLACYRCNEFKGSRTEAADPLDGQLAVLFYPRLQRWSEHLVWRFLDQRRAPQGRRWWTQQRHARASREAQIVASHYAATAARSAGALWARAHQSVCEAASGCRLRHSGLGLVAAQPLVQEHPQHLGTA